MAKPNEVLGEMVISIQQIKLWWSSSIYGNLAFCFYYVARGESEADKEEEEGEDDDDDEEKQEQIEIVSIKRLCHKTISQVINVSIS